MIEAVNANVIEKAIIPVLYNKKSNGLKRMTENHVEI